MPVHDWTRVRAGTFHDFHCTWIPEIKNRLNEGILPDDMYAQVEQVTGDAVADVLTLQSDPEPGTNGHAGKGGLAVAVAPPKVRFVEHLEASNYATRARRVVVRHSSDDRVVAVIEIVSPGNKSSRAALAAFVSKAGGLVAAGRHVLVIDLFPPGPRDPNGIHAAIWDELGGPMFSPPADKPLTLAAYTAGAVYGSYVEPLAVGDPMADMPLFIHADRYVTVPLAQTYATAFQGVPRKYRSVLESP